MSSSLKVKPGRKNIQSDGVKYDYSVWRSQSNAAIKKPHISKTERAQVGVYVHTVLPGKTQQCWLNDPDEDEWIDVTEDYNTDNGEVLYPKLRTHVLTSLRGPNFILIHSFERRSKYVPLVESESDSNEE